MTSRDSSRKFEHAVRSWLVDSAPFSLKDRIFVLADFMATRKPEALVPHPNSDSQSFLALKTIGSWLDPNTTGALDGDEAALAMLPVFKELVDTAISQSSTTAATSAAHKHMEQVQALKNEINISKMKAERMKSQRSHSMVFASLLAGFILVSILLVKSMPGAEAVVSIEYNVGEIIAALLGGTGVAAAGLAYAARAVRGLPKTEDDEPC